MHDTPTSRISNKIRPINNMKRGIIDLFGPWEPRRVNNKCPAIMLAPSRTDRVPGRIILLTVSMITIIGIRIPGVPVGTRWASNELYWYTIDTHILPIQIGSASVIVIDKWLVPVKIYGNKPIKFENKIKIKNEINRNTVPGTPIVENTANNSSSRYKNNFSILLDIWEPTNQYNWGTIDNKSIHDNQFRDIEKSKKLIIGSNDENRFVI